MFTFPILFQSILPLKKREVSSKKTILHFYPLMQSIRASVFFLYIIIYRLQQKNKTKNKAAHPCTNSANRSKTQGFSRLFPQNQITNIFYPRLFPVCSILGHSVFFCYLFIFSVDKRTFLWYSYIVEQDCTHYYERKGSRQEQR